MSAGHEELVKLGAVVEGVLVAKDAALDEECFLAEFAFELMFAEDHGEEAITYINREETVDRK